MDWKLGAKTLTWKHDENRVDTDNLWIDSLWNMRETVGFEDMCVLVRVISDTEFSFWTFGCFRYDMKLENDRVSCVRKTFTK